MKRSTANSKPKRHEGLKADYKGATPEQVARAVLTYRPGAKGNQAPKPPPVTAG